MAVRSRYSRDAEHFVVATPFEWKGRSYAAGKAFPWRELEVTEPQRRDLWVSNKIDTCEAPAPAQPKRARAGA